MSTEQRSYTFQALGPNGTREAGVLHADSREEVVALIQSRGSFAVDIQEVSGSLAGRERRVALADQAAGLRGLAALLNAGLPVSRALAALDDLVPPSWAPTLPVIREQVEKGEPMAAALDASPLGLPAHVIGIIRAGEQGSGLPAAVDTAAALLEGRAATRTALRNALAYPAMLAVVGGASVALLVGVVLPRFSALLLESGQALPAMTGLVLSISDITRSLAFPAVIATVLSVAGARAWLARPAAMARWHAFLLKLPEVGRIRHAAATAHAASTMASLLAAGVPLPAALLHGGTASGDRAVEARLATTRQRLLSGEPISRALAAEAAMSPIAIRFARIGEETGSLGEMLQHAGRLASDDALRRVQRLLRLAEPIMILLFGGLVMLVAGALLQAMYGLRP